MLLGPPVRRPERCAPPTRLIDTEDPASRSTSPTLLVIWAVWTLTVVVLLASHEMWRDELQAWAIARDSSSPLELLSNLRYEGHPPGWHVVLWLVSRATRSPVAAQVVTAACGSAATWIVLRYMPFTLPVRALLVAGYFPLYEFGTISRSYGLLYLLTVAFLALADRRPGWSPALVLLLLGMVSTVIVAIPLVVALAVGHWLRSRRLDVRRSALAGMALAVSCAVALLLARPPADGRRIEERLLRDVDLDRVLRAPARALLPMPELSLDFWNRFITANLESREALLGVLVLVGVGIALRRSRAALMVWAVCATGFMGLVAGLSLPMAARQISILWLGLVAAVWIAGSGAANRKADGSNPTALILKLIGTLALAVAVAAAGWAALVDVRNPFSGGEGAAAWIADQFDESPAILCATRAPYCSAVSMHLDEPAYMRVDAEPFTFVTWRRQRPGHVAGGILLDEARALRELTGREVVVVALTGSTPPGCDSGWVSEPTIERSERMVVCRSDQLTPVAQ